MSLQATISLSRPGVDVGHRLHHGAATGDRAPAVPGSASEQQLPIPAGRASRQGSAQALGPVHAADGHASGTSRRQNRALEPSTDQPQRRNSAQAAVARAAGSQSSARSIGLACSIARWRERATPTIQDPGAPPASSSLQRTLQPRPFLPASEP